MTSITKPNDESTACDPQEDKQDIPLELNQSTTRKIETSDAVTANQTSVTNDSEPKIATSTNIQGCSNTENNTPAGDDSKADPSTESATAESEQSAKKAVVGHENNDKHSNLEENIKPQQTDKIDQNANQRKSQEIGQNRESDDNNAEVTSKSTTCQPQSCNTNQVGTSESVSEIGSQAQENLPFNRNSPPADKSSLEKPTDTSQINPNGIEDSRSEKKEHETHDPNEIEDIQSGKKKHEIHDPNEIEDIQSGKKKHEIHDPNEIEEKQKAQDQFQQAIDNDQLKDYKKFVYKIDQGKSWLDLQFHNQEQKSDIKKPHEIEVPDLSKQEVDRGADVLDRIKGSMVGMALGDALGARVEFRPHAFLMNDPVKDLEGGGTWGLTKGQFTDDTSMALCLANSLIACRDFVPYDQLVRYKWWYDHGYMSSTGKCFDIGNATRESIEEFRSRQNQLANKLQMPVDDVDYLNDREKLNDFNEYCSSDGVAGNGALMRLAPVPLFFFRSPKNAVEYSGISGQITHGDTKAYDACRYYGALIVAALHGFKKDQLLNNKFYSKYKSLFGEKELHDDIKKIAEGSYKSKNGYDGGIRGKGYIVDALEAALWAFYSTKSFEDGVLAAVNLGDDADTTAAIYGQLAGAFYGYKRLPEKWTVDVYAREFLEKLSEWIAYEGDRWCKSPVASTE